MLKKRGQLVDLRKYKGFRKSATSPNLAEGALAGYSVKYSRYIKIWPYEQRPFFWECVKQD